MKKYKLQILFIVTYALWFIPWEFKKTLPSIFGSNYLQWSLTAIVSILIPIGSLWSLSWIQKGRRSGYWLLLAFSVPLLISLFSYAVVSPMLMRLQIHQLSFFSKDVETISTLSNQIYESKPQDKQKNLARARILYGFYGIKPYLPSENGRLKIYSPTEKDVKRWKEMQETKQMAIQTENMIKWQLKQIPWLFSVYLGNYILIMALGLGFYSYKRNNNDYWLVSKFLD